MSQLELALKKARASAADLESDVVTPGRPVPNAAFVSAWAVEDAPALPRRDVTPVPDSPAVEPHTHKASRAVDTTSRFKDFSEDVRPKLVIGEQALPDMREQFGKIAAVLYRLREAQPEQRVKVLMVVSAVPGEGKSLMAMNLALTLSEAYKTHVLLIDADLRRPSIHQLLDVPNGSGLKDALTSRSTEPLPTVAVSPHLHVLTAGSTPVDPMGALISDRMHQLLRDAADAFDWVVIDTPPVTLIPDAHLLASMTDAAVLVVEAGATEYALAREAVDIIGRDRVLGVVLNKVAERPRTDRYGAYGYYGEQHARK